MHNFQAHTEEIRNEMLSDIGVQSIDNLFDVIPKEARIEGLNLDKSLSEMEANYRVDLISKLNRNEFISFLGGGAYDHYIPACVSQITSRFEFNTAYTPYQPEISQGTLQAIYEFQSAVCNLTGMDVSNASVYDGGTACAEAILMSAKINKKKKVLISKCLNPQYIEVIKTYCNANDIKIDYISEKNLATDLSNINNFIESEEYDCVLIQTPNLYGEIEDLETLKNSFENSKTILIACVNPVSLLALKKPSEYFASIVVGDMQPFGLPVSYGGAYCGFIACIDKYKRQLTGRIVGKTLDKEGKQAFTLTLQAREQHIRREKATGNICSNQALSALSAIVYISAMGKKGLEQVAYLSSKNAHYLANKLQEKGIKTLNTNFFNEFVIEVKDADEFLSNMKQKNILAGIKLNKNRILLCTTEKTFDSYIKILLESIEE